MLALVALTTAVPGLATDVAVLSGVRRSLTTGGESGSSALNDAALVTASVVIWVVLGWGCLVLGLAALARIPGVLGRFGRASLGRIAPATVRRVVIAGVGVSVLAGAAACGVDRPIAAIPQAAHGSSAVELSSAAVGAPPQLDTWSVTAERGVPSPAAVAPPSLPPLRSVPAMLPVPAMLLRAVPGMWSLRCVPALPPSLSSVATR